MDRREVLAQGAVAAACLLLGGSALAGGRVLVEKEMELREGYGWITLDHRPTARVWRAVRPYVTARTRHRPGGACVSLETLETDRETVLALLEGG